MAFNYVYNLKIPEEIVKISLFKKSLCVESYNLAFLGNFIFKIRSCKIPDSYKGKGFYYKYEKKSLKAIKKK
jgi:ribosomal protein L6P/L9E